jgi:peptidoglycan/LPS O-acetylase OafA/YrhL
VVVAASVTYRLIEEPARLFGQRPWRVSRAAARTAPVAPAQGGLAASPEKIAP